MSCQEEVQRRVPKKITDCFPKTIDDECARGTPLRSIADLLFRMWKLRCKSDEDVIEREKVWADIVAMLQKDFPWLNEDQWFSVYEAYGKGDIYTVEQAVEYVKSHFPKPPGYR